MGINDDGSYEVDELVLDKHLLEGGIDDVRLVGIHGPSRRELELLGFELVPTGPSHHELPRNFAPSLLPIDPGIVDKDSHLIDTGVVSDQTEPTPSHRPKLVLVLYETVIVELVLKDGALVVCGDGVIRAKFFQRDYVSPHTLDLDLALEVTLEGGQEETV